jgi:uncharacterized protein (DUF2267 family)
MRYATFMDIVEQQSGLSRPESDRATRAVLETLSERITRGEALDIAAFLPEPLQAWLTWAPEPAEPFGLDEFIRRVAKRANLDRAEAAAATEAVFAALGQAVAPGELRDMAAQLPREYDRLLAIAGAGRRTEPDDLDLVGQVAALGGLDRDVAARAAEAVLEVLGERISAGEAEDFEPDLPAELREALRRGYGRKPAAVPMPAGEFVRRVAELEGVSPHEAEQHVRAVFAALRKLLPDKEFADLAAQLSRDYEELLTPSAAPAA